MRKHLEKSLLFLVILSPFSTWAQDVDEIKTLVIDFVREQKSGGDTQRFLNPHLSADERATLAEAIAGPYSEYEFYDFAGPVVNGDHAQLHARLHSRTPSSEFDKPVTVAFDKVDGHWYFATYKNLGFPASLVTVLVSGAIFYVLVSLSYYMHVRRKDLPRKLLWEVLVLTPVGWILYPMRKPWKR